MMVRLLVRMQFVNQQRPNFKYMVSFFHENWIHLHNGEESDIKWTYANLESLSYARLSLFGQPSQSRFKCGWKATKHYLVSGKMFGRWLKSVSANGYMFRGNSRYLSIHAFLCSNQHA